MKLLNKSGNGLSHSLQIEKNGKKENQNYFIAIGQVLDVPEEIAKVWLKIPGVEKFVEVEDLAKIEEENKKLKAELEKSKNKNKKNKK